MESKTAIGEKLKQARTHQKITLDDIASSTRINRSFLSDIEDGKVPDVPPTYLRAFLRTFSEYVGLDPAPILKEYFAEPPPPPPPPQAQAQKPLFEAEISPPRRPVPKQASSSGQRQVKVLLVLSAALLGTLAILVYWLHEQQSGTVTQEISFMDAVKDNEKKQTPVKKDSAALRPVLVPRPDSLSLEAVASESVWVHIVIDSLFIKEYVLTPNHRLQWKAKREFVISLGNAGGIVLSLNGARLGAIGKPRKSVRNVPLNWQTWEKLQQEGTKKDNG